MTDTLPDILLVEDNPNDAELALRALRKATPAVHVLVVRDGVEALDFLRGTGPFHGRDVTVLPKVMFLDLKLPRVDGLEVLRQVRDDPRLKCMPVVILTSSRQERDVTECYRLGANGYVVKPVDFATFSETLGTSGRYWLTINQPPPAAVHEG